jgi:hypothetical protein
MKPPKVFISYSYDSDDHKKWVLKLATDLVERGVEVILDQWDLALGQDISAFMENSVSLAGRVLLVCTEDYVTKANEGRGGVGYERLIVSSEIVARIDTKKFVPLVRAGGPTPRLPNFLGPRRYLDFSPDGDYQARLEELVRELHGVPAVRKPTLGRNPYAATPPADPEPGRTAGPSGLLPSGRPLLSDPWFEECSAYAKQGIAKVQLNGSMEMRFGLHDGTRKSQMELLTAVENSEVHTFGWPIGVTLENREECKPKPYSDGIRAEIAILDRVLNGESSYDYWAARTNGDFYTLQSFFEDMRAKGKLFFNTRIVRITEGLMFASNLYKNLGIPSDSRLSVAFGHQGLAGRTIASSTMNRQVSPRKAAEDRSEGQITDSVEGLRKNIVDHVVNIAAPMFMLFDFAEFERTVYADIVNAYVAGRVT